MKSEQDMLRELVKGIADKSKDKSDNTEKNNKDEQMTIGVYKPKNTDNSQNTDTNKK